MHIDITHGFRSIPLFISTILTYFENTKKADVQGVYYGIFEARDQNNITPVVNIQPLLELNDWITATSVFAEYGDGRKIATLLSNHYKKLEPDQKREFNAIQKLSSQLEFHSKAVGFAAPRLYLENLQNISKNISNKEILHSFSPALDYVIESFEQEISQYKTFSPDWKNFLTAAEIFFEKNRLF
ncbi:MAG: TIGR02221 family CRISPR-associated protein [Methylococcaceae bacterium]|nr:TIGR02221 family CRISPR-associated protein [Methylococcaceae bacterium]